jgi:hypothetical protein
VAPQKQVEANAIATMSDICMIEHSLNRFCSWHCRLFAHDTCEALNYGPL